MFSQRPIIKKSNPYATTLEEGFDGEDNFVKWFDVPPVNPFENGRLCDFIHETVLKIKKEFRYTRPSDQRLLTFKLETPKEEGTHGLNLHISYQNFINQTTLEDKHTTLLDMNIRNRGQVYDLRWTMDVLRLYWSMNDYDKLLEREKMYYQGKIPEYLKHIYPEPYPPEFKEIYNPNNYKGNPYGGIPLQIPDIHENGKYLPILPRNFCLPRSSATAVNVKVPMYNHPVCQQSHFTGFFMTSSNPHPRKPNRKSGHCKCREAYVDR